MNCDYTGWWPKHIIARAGENFSNSFCQENGLLPKIDNFCNSAPSPRSFQFFPPALQATQFLSPLFGVTEEKSPYQKGEKKENKKKEQKGKETMRRSNVTFAFHLQNCNCFSMYVFLPFWSLLQRSRVCSSLHRAGGRWDNSGSSVSRLLLDWVSPRLRRRGSPAHRDQTAGGWGYTFPGDPLLRKVLNMLMVIPALYLHINCQSRGTGLTSTGDITRV